MDLGPDSRPPKGARRPGTAIPRMPAELLPRHLEVVQRVLGFLDQGFRDGTPSAAIARTVGVSRSHLCRIFRRVTGQSMKSFLTRRRLQAAKAMLQVPTVMVQQVAVTVGFRDLSHFDRVFRSLEGQSPSSYRRRFVQEARPAGCRETLSAKPHRAAPSLA